jgi:hypothetical protein
MINSPDVPMDARDLMLLEGLGRVFSSVDPPPAGLAERALFALTLDDLHAEMVELTRVEMPELAVRGEETVEARTVTFTAEPCTVMVTLSPSDEGAVRVDGWVAPAARYSVVLYRPDARVTVESDDDGRFVIDHVPQGPASLVLRLNDDSGPAVSTPVIEI